MSRNYRYLMKIIRMIDNETVVFMQEASYYVRIFTK